MKPNSTFYSIVLLLALSGCKANQDSLEDFVIQVEAKARKEVEQLVPATEFSAAPINGVLFVLPLNCLKKQLCKTSRWLRKIAGNLALVLAVAS